MKRFFAAVALVATLSFGALPVAARSTHTPAVPTGAGPGGFNCALAGVFAGIGVVTLDPVVVGIATIVGAQACAW